MGVRSSERRHGFTPIPVSPVLFRLKELICGRTVSAEGAPMPLLGLQTPVTPPLLRGGCPCGQRESAKAHLSIKGLGDQSDGDRQWRSY